MTGGSPLEVAIVGAGPTASSLLERLAGNLAELWDGTPLRVHLVDPHPAGLGRVWRPDLDPRLWMNSMAEDVTLFTDDSVRCEGPVLPGPSLHEWSQEVDDAALAAVAPPDVVAEARGLDGTTFPSRRVQSAYLRWFHGKVLGSLPADVEVVAHRGRAVSLRDDADGRQRLAVDGEVEQELTVDVVVLTLGHLDAAPDGDGRAMADFAARRGLVYLPPAHTADLDLVALEAGADVLALGFGQAFTDLVVLLTEGRGGRFVEDGDGLRYEPSGREPVLHVGSRRGVPYRTKPGYRLGGPRPPLPHVLDEPTVVARLARRDLDFRTDLLPLAAKEAGWAYYHELFHAHPGRTAIPWEEFATAYDELDWGAPLDRLVADAVPSHEDRLDLLALDRPLAGLRFASAGDLHRHVRDHVAADVARRTDPSFSADLGGFIGLLTGFGALSRLAPALRPRSRVEDLAGWWFSFFMYFASGPPAPRLRQVLALSDAGLLHFVGAGMTVEADPSRGCFVARSESHPDAVEASILVDARIATPSLSRSADVMLRRLLEDGELVEEVVRDGAWTANTGKVVVDGADLRVRRRDGTNHPRRHALGIFTNKPAAAAFARPHTNAPVFRQNDAVARSILTTLAGLAAQRRSEGPRSRLAS
jgi:uncharacterized NAD(P)/FAD-binding protein YdhS